MTLDRDNFGRLVVRKGEAIYYLHADGATVMALTYSHSTDRQGRIWQTPHCRKVRGPAADRIRAQLQGRTS